MYCGANRKRPLKFSQNVLDLQAKANTFTVQNVHFVAEFPSCTAVVRSDENDKDNVEPLDPYKNMEPSSLTESIVDVCSILIQLHAAIKWTKEVYTLCRTVAV